MSVSNWLFNTCGRSHIGIYVCSKCGYELLRSGFEQGFKKSIAKALLPPTSGKKHRVGDSFAESMVEDFTKNANMGRTFHKNSFVKTMLGAGKDDNQTTFKIACGKCGSSLGHQMSHKGYSTFDIKFESVDLTFRAS